MKHLRIFTFCVLALSLSTATVQAQNLSIDSVYFDRSTGLINTLVSGVGNNEYRSNNHYKMIKQKKSNVYICSVQKVNKHQWKK